MIDIDRMCDKIDAFFSVPQWPQPLRRIFVAVLETVATYNGVTILLSGPLWIFCYLLTLIVAGLLIGIFLFIPTMIKELWQTNYWDRYDH